MQFCGRAILIDNPWAWLKRNAEALRRIASGLALAAVLPACSLFVSKPVQYTEYTVRPGDTLYAIAERHGVSLKAIVDANSIRRPDKIEAGQRLKIPPGGKGSAGRKPGYDPKSYRTIELTHAKRYIGRLEFPVRSGRFNSRFGARWSSFHEGIDISAPEGTPIYAAHDGQVAHSGTGFRGYGNIIILKGEGLLTVYAHNRRNVVDRGDRVRRGEKIGEVGATGRASGPHLHFETRVQNKKGNWVAVDPLAFYP